MEYIARRKARNRALSGIRDALVGSKPTLSLHGRMAKMAGKRRINYFTVSISQTSGCCVAPVILAGA
jgi:phosphopantetheinyl transferase (holo-ACP synthase)